MGGLLWYTTTCGCLQTKSRHSIPDTEIIAKYAVKGRNLFVGPERMSKLLQHGELMKSHSRCMITLAISRSARSAVTTALQDTAILLCSAGEGMAGSREFHTSRTTSVLLRPLKATHMLNSSHQDRQASHDIWDKGSGIFVTTRGL